MLTLAPLGILHLLYLAMKDLLLLLAHLLTTLAKLLGPGGTRAVVADSLREATPKRFSLTTRLSRHETAQRLRPVQRLVILLLLRPVLMLLV